MNTILELIQKGANYLEQKGVLDARSNMQHLIAHVLGCSRMQLYCQFERVLTPSQLEQLRELLKQRAERKPLQHLIGNVDFFGQSFQCDARALIPRPETEELVEIILKSYKDSLPGSRLLDVGCGSGVIGLSLLKARPEWEITLSDLSEEALSLAKENAQHLQLEPVNFIQSDLFEGIHETFHGMVANLPYVESGSELEPEVHFDPSLSLYGGTDGLDIIRRFIPQAYAHLEPGGWLILEVGKGQNNSVEQLFQETGFTEIKTHHDLSGVARFPAAKKTN